MKKAIQKYIQLTISPKSQKNIAWEYHVCEGVGNYYTDLKICYEAAN